MKKIICPTDFSEASRNAIVYAAKLAQAIHAELVLFNVQSLYDLSPVELIRGKDITVAAAGELLESQSREVAQTFKISCYAEVEPTYSTLSKIIHDRAKGYDLVVMGTNGPEDLFDFLTGSHTYQAIVKSETPALMIPNGYLYTEIQNMVYAFDYLHEQRLPMEGIIRLVKTLSCDLTVLQVMEEAQSKDEDMELRELQYIFNQKYGKEIKLTFDTIRSSEIAPSINSYINRTEADVLALCSIHRNFLQRMVHKSVIKNISVVLNYPVLVFHE